VPARAWWRGQIRLALVSIAVEIYSATRSTAEVAFRQIHRPSGKPVRYQKMVPGVGPVRAEDIARGFEIGHDQYVLVDEDELEALRLESRRTLELSLFVDAGAIDAIYFDRPFYVVPADDLAEEAYGVLRDALRKTGKVGVGQLAVRGREHLVALKPCGPGMTLETLHYSEELNRAAGYFRDIRPTRPDPELLDLATALIERRSGPFDAAAYHDHYVAAVRDLVERKRAGGTIRVEETSAAGAATVIDLMAALRRSVESAAAPAAPPRAARRRSKQA
jgi:DNA end-binding protein Ku